MDTRSDGGPLQSQVGPAGAFQGKNRISAVYVADAMTDARMLEGLADRFDLTVLAPSSMRRSVTNWWPPHRPAPEAFHFLKGGRITFSAKATSWLVRNRKRFAVALVLDNLTAALGATTARKLGGPPVILLVGRPTQEYFRSKARTGGKTGGFLLGLAAVKTMVSINERGADGIGTVSEYVAEQSLRRNDRVVPIPFYGVNTEVFAPRWSKQEARAHLELDGDQPIVLYRSRIAPEKDPESFLFAVDLLRRKGREIKAVYMGGEFPTFASIASRHEVEVECRDARSRDELPMWYVAADVTVQTSYTEGLGISLLESLACETPIVVTDVGGLREVAAEGECGLMVPPGDPGAAANAIETLLDDPIGAALLAKKGRQHVLEKYSEKAAFDSWERLAMEVARGTRS